MTTGSVGHSPTPKFAWTPTSLLDEMTFLVVSLSSLIGSFFGNLVVFWILGQLAQKQQEKQREELERLQTEFLTMRQKEVERMQRYAKMES